jgi:hypothetical protein
MPAKSKAQRRFMGIVNKIMSGGATKKYSDKAMDAARNMKKKAVRHFASTAEAGLPKKVSGNSSKKSSPRKIEKKSSPFSIFEAKKKIEKRKKKSSDLEDFFKGQGQ